MTRSTVRVWVVGLTLGCAAIAASAAQFVVVLKPGGASWQVLEAEKITFDGKDKLRSGSSKKLDLSPDEYKRLQAQPIPLAGTVRMHAGGYLVHKQGGDWQPVVPDGATVKAATSYAALWSSATATLQKTKDAKSVAAIRVADLFAVLPAGTRDEAVAAFLEDEDNFHGVGERDADAAFQERMSLLVGVAGSVAGAPGTRIQQLLLLPMETINQQLSAGIAHYSDLQRGLQFATVSELAYPNDERQQRVRAALSDKLHWLDQRKAILKAFSAGELWDAFLDKYPEFERWENSFDEFPKLREKAFQESAGQHKAEGVRLYEAKHFAPALKELKLALVRSPGDQNIAALVEKVAIDEEREYSRLVKAKVLTPTEDVQIMRNLHNAENSIAGGRLKEAGDELAHAEAIDQGSPQIMFVRAELLLAGKEIQKALDMLDSCSRRVTSREDLDKVEALRSSIGTQLRMNKDNLKKAIKNAEDEGDYVSAMRNAEQGLALDPKDLDFLLHAGKSGVILRRSAEARTWLKQYLDLSQGPGNDAKLRAQVINVIAVSQTKTREPDGKPNWFSGYKSPANVFYCPESLIPNAHVAAVKGPRGLLATFEWNRDVLTKVHTVEQDAKGGLVSGTVYFDYFKDQKAVRRVGMEQFSVLEEPPTPRFTPFGPVGAGEGRYVALPNHPVVDPLMVERLMTKPVATLVVGNPYFNPFVWDGIFSFLAEYDDQGRVQSARQIGVVSGQAPHEFDFKWDGMRLMEIAERGGSGYRRTMAYTNNRLMSETIAFQGKTTRIDYKYQGDQLVEASSGDDPSIDGRSRKVTFR
jgi:tetratricopeptide (TPR) repeat protein